MSGPQNLAGSMTALHLREAITAGDQALVVNSNDRTQIGLEIRPSSREREVLLAGGTLKFACGA